MPSRTARRVILANLLVPIAGYVVWDQIETRALKREIAAIAARGEPTTVDAIPPGGETSERQLAARVYAAAEEQVRALPREIAFRLPRIDVDSLAAPAVNLEELERTYRHDAPALQLLDQAAPLDFNGFGDFAPDVGDQFLPTLAYLCLVRADLLSARGRGDVAASALVPCVRVWRTVSILSRSQVSTRLLASLRILLRHTQPSPAVLAGLQSALEGLPDGDALSVDIQHRRARFLDEIAAPRATLTDAVARRALRPYVTRSNRRQLQTFDEALAIAAQPWPDKLAAGRHIESRYAEAFRSMNRGFFARLAPPQGIGFAALALVPAARDLTARRVSVATLAVERYRRANRGALPPSLAALVPAYLASVPIDPFSGGSLVLKATNTGYRLYSVDTDLADDGGALYGIGSRVQLMPQQRAPRDLGLEVTGPR